VYTADSGMNHLGSSILNVHPLRFFTRGASTNTEIQNSDKTPLVAGSSSKHSQTDHHQNHIVRSHDSEDEGGDEPICQQHPTQSVEERIQIGHQSLPIISLSVPLFVALISLKTQLIRA